MASEAQIQAARTNGAKSLGPTTPEGKAVSSQNARKHGLSSRKFILEDEDQEAFNALLADYHASYAPANRGEQDLVHEMVVHRFRLEHVWACRAAAYDLQNAMQDPVIANHVANVEPDLLAARALVEQQRNGEADAFSRYENHHSRLYNRALRNLLQVQRHRARFPQSQPQPQPEPQPAAAPPAEPRLYSINDFIDGGHIPSLREPRKRTLPAAGDQPHDNRPQNEPDPQRASEPLVEVNDAAA